MVLLHVQCLLKLLHRLPENCVLYFSHHVQGGALQNQWIPAVISIPRQGLNSCRRNRMGLDGCKVRPYEYVPSGHFFNHGQIHTFNGIEILQARSNHWRLWKKRMLHPLRNKQCVLCAIASRNIKKQLKQIDLHDLPVFSAMHFCYFLYVAFQGRSPAPFDAFCETLRCVSPGETLR